MSETLTICPGGCGMGYTPGVETYCERCDAYYADMEGATTDPTPEARARLTDTRSEDERKRDAKSAVEALGWIVVDTEQGYRPTHCPDCKAKLPGGGSTRTRRGFPDWVVMGFGVVAFIEWKSATGTQTPHQRAFQEDCERVGVRVPYAVCRTTSEAVAFLRGLMPKD